MDSMDSMDCPKCHTGMTEHTLSTLSGGVTVDKCSACRGICFDLGEHGMYFDAGEFTDFKYETLMDIFRDFVFALRKPA